MNAHLDRHSSLIRKNNSRIVASTVVFWRTKTRRIGLYNEGANMSHIVRKLWRGDDGQDIAEYAVMLAVILVLVVGTIRLVGSNANNAFSSVASSLQ